MPRLFLLIHAHNKIIHLFSETHFKKKKNLNSKTWISVSKHFFSQSEPFHLDLAQCDFKRKAQHGLFFPTFSKIFVRFFHSYSFVYFPPSGQPKTRAFVTHGGTNGLYEAVFHGVPLVGLPVFGDQSYNLNRMSHLGTAIVLDFNKVTAEELAEALHAIVNQPR